MAATRCGTVKKLHGRAVDRKGNTMVLETSRFKTRAGISDEQLVAASQEAHDGFLSTCKGLVSRELLKGDDGSWLDIVEFDSIDDARAAMAAFRGHPSTRAFEAAIDPETARMEHFEPVRRYGANTGLSSKVRTDDGREGTRQPDEAQRGPGSASADVGMTSDGRSSR